MSEFAHLASRMEQRARQHPKAFPLWVLALSYLGWVYVALIVATILGLIGGLALAAFYLRQAVAIKLALKLGIPLLVLAGLILRALWVKLEPPQGIAVGREQAPRLFTLIDELRARLQIPRLTSVVVTDDFNAAVSQTPRLGLLGWYRRDLILGLPLMHALSPTQFKAVLGHEFGHLSGAHGRRGVRIYRARQAWYQLMTALETDRHWGTKLFRRFFEWYAPYFGACSLGLARLHELEADRMAAELTTAEAIGEALIRVELLGASAAQRFWSEVQHRVGVDPDPPPGVYAEMRDALAAPPMEPMHALLQPALQRTTGGDDTHPALSERLRALAVSPEPPRPITDNAAEQLLGDLDRTLTEELSRKWAAGVREQWREEHRRRVQERERLTVLEDAVRTRPLLPQEEWERAALTEETLGPEAALPLYLTFVAAHPEHASALFAAGRLRLEREDPEGIGLLERAMAQDVDAVLPACQLILAHLSAKGAPPEDVARYVERADRGRELLQRAAAERESISVNDSFGRHAACEAHLSALRQALESQVGLTAAWLIRKEVQHLPERPLHVLLVEPRTRAKEKSGDWARRLAAELPLPGECFVVVLDSSTKALKRRATELSVPVWEAPA